MLDFLRRGPVITAIVMLIGVITWQTSTGPVDVVASIDGPSIEAVAMATPAATSTVPPSTLAEPPTAEDFAVVADPERVAEIIASRAKAPAPAASSASTTDDDIRIIEAYGPRGTDKIQIHRSIAPELAQLIADAKADGIELGGWGWRSHQTQIRLRREHCGTSDYAIWHKPSSQCSPPTATPGNSNHETGKAIDFTVNGKAIGSRKSLAFKWLKANAAKYGLKNLPSEPWHWSVNGR